MKIKFYYTLILCLSINFCFSQKGNVYNSNYKVTYKLTYQKDSTDAESTASALFVLLIGKNMSLFQSKNSRFNDSLVHAISNKFPNSSDIADMQTAVSLALNSKKYTRFDFKIWKTQQEIVTMDKVFTDEFVYKEKPEIQWQLSNEKKQINGFQCQKATCYFSGRNYTAWFTYEIPIAEGPYKFSGLPGLIVEISDDRNHYVFEMIGFKEHNEDFLMDIEGIPTVEKSEFFKAKENFKKSFVSQLRAKGVILRNSRSVEKRVQNSRNNSIEIHF